MAVVLEAYVNGVSTRKVNQLVEQLGIDGMTKDRVSAVCWAWTRSSSYSGQRPLERLSTPTCGSTPSRSRSATTAGRFQGGGGRLRRVRRDSGVREVIGLDVGEVESGAFWTEFLRALKKRGLDGVRLAISDQHEGLKGAIARVLGCPWQRCATFHFTRDMVMHCRRDQRGLVAAALRYIINAEGYQQARGSRRSRARAARHRRAEGV